MYKRRFVDSVTFEIWQSVLQKKVSVQKADFSSINCFVDSV